MNTVEGFFAVGAIIGPAIVAHFLAVGTSGKWLYVVARSMHVLLILAVGGIVFSTWVAAVVASLAMGAIRDSLGDPKYGLILATGCGDFSLSGCF
jgi:fucose permease